MTEQSKFDDPGINQQNFMEEEEKDAEASYIGANAQMPILGDQLQEDMAVEAQPTRAKKKKQKKRLTQKSAFSQKQPPRENHQPIEEPGQQYPEVEAQFPQMNVDFDAENYGNM